MFWLAVYREPANIRRCRRRSSPHCSDPAVGAACLAQLLRYRQTWAFVIGKSLTDPVWLLYLSGSRSSRRGSGVKLSGVAARLIAIYVFADAGSVVAVGF